MGGAGTPGAAGAGLSGPERGGGAVSAPPPLLDAHHHVWDPEHRPQPWIDPARMGAIDRAFGPADLRAAVDDLAARGAARVAGTVVVQTVPDPAETPELLELAAADDLVTGVVGWVDLTGDAAAQLDALLAHPAAEHLVGVRAPAQEEPDPAWLDRPDVRAGIAAAAARGLAVDLLVTARELPAAVRLVHEVEGPRYVLDHLGKPPVAAGGISGWAAQLRGCAAAPGVAAKLSGLVTEADWSGWSAPVLRPWVEVALEAFGPARLALGSDWPVCLLAGSYADVVAASLECLAGLAPGERDAVLAGTAREVYRLPG